MKLDADVTFILLKIFFFFYYGELLLKFPFNCVLVTQLGYIIADP